MSTLDRIKRWFQRTAREGEDVVEGAEPVATPPSGSSGDADRETSTNAQMQGARDEPWSGS
jgi:hypothetical protein